MGKKKKIKEPKKIYPIDERSTDKTFDEWLSECGNDLCNFGGILSCSGSDGPNISKEKVGKAHFNMPLEVEQFLIDEGLYEKKKVMCSEYYNYNPPTKHYIDWFNEKYKINN